MCFLKNSLSKGISPINWFWEDGLCLCLNKQFFGFDDNMIILFVYMSGTSSTRRDLDTGTDCYDKLFDKLAEVCVGGGKSVTSG